MIQRRTKHALGLTAVAVALLLAPQGFNPAIVDAQRVRFFSDDPLSREPETQDASKIGTMEVGLSSDLLLNLFTQVGDRRTNVRAQNINTIDEVPESSWFNNRIYTRDISLDEIARGPNASEPPASGRWTVTRGKATGAAPGFTARDEKGQLWFISFDGKDLPVAPTAAAMVATKLFWALGYNQVETHLTTIRPENLSIDPKATLRAHGKRRAMTMDDVEDVFERSARSADGSYRAVAGRAVDGYVGNFRYHGTRPDDPNDVIDHEHRRELRALKVFGAWTNLVDMKAGNTLDALTAEGDRKIVKHFLQDVGSTFGTGANAPRDGDEGHEYLYEGGPAAKRLFTFGLFLSPWQTMKYVENDEIGRFEGTEFEPEDWKPRVPVPALRHARADDNLWAALRVMAFGNEHIATAVKAGGYTDPAAEKLLADVLIQRRDKIGRAFLAAVNPLTRFAVSGDAVTFENPAVKAGYAAAPKGGYEATWATFNNGTGEASPIGSPVTSADERVQLPAAVPASEQFVKVSIRAVDPPHAPWSTPVNVYLRRAAGGWQLVGVER